MCHLKFLSTFFLLLGVFIFPNQLIAKVGVGVGTGKIVIDQNLKSGSIYDLPPLTVFNTGDVATEYRVEAAYHEQQPELKPSREWFSFTPNKFSLQPGEAQEVKIQLHLPVKTEPGTYFAYLESSPVATGESGNTRVGIAAAAKLYFQVTPSTFWEGLYYRGLSLWSLYQPWTSRVAYGLGLVAVLFLFKKFFHVQINLKKPTDE
jgi:hypothetical protein